jgi:hypothetical protein
MLFNHNWDDPIGMVNTADLRQQRLNVNGVLFNTSRGQEVGSMIESGLKTSHWVTRYTPER